MLEELEFIVTHLLPHIFAGMICTFILMLSAWVLKLKLPVVPLFLLSVLVTGMTLVFTPFSLSFLVFLSILMCCSSIVWLKSRKEDVVSTLVYVLGVCLMSLGVGIGFSVSMLVLSILLFMVSFVSAKLLPLSPALSPYVLSLDIQKLAVVERIEALFEALPIEVDQKVLTRQKSIQLDIQYKTTPLVQHVLLQRLFRMRGIGQVVKF